MLDQVDEALSSFTDSWEDYLNGGRNQLRLTLEDAEFEDCVALVDDVENLSESANTGSLSFDINGSGERYSITYHPSRGSISGTRDQGSGTPIRQNYRGNDELIGILTDLKDNVLSGKEEMIKSLEVITSAGQHHIDIGCTIRASRIEEVIDQEIHEPETSVIFYFSWRDFQTHIQETGLAESRNLLLGKDDHKSSLVVIHSLGGYVQGNALSVFGLESLALDGYSSGRPRWIDQMEEIKRQSLIQEPDRRFLPPSFFKFYEASNEELEGKLQRLFYPHIAVFSILSIANTAEYQNGAIWNVRIQGRQYLEGGIATSSSNTLTVTIGDDEKSIELTKEHVDNLYSLYCWVYEHNSDNRISVVRNVATLYAENLVELVTGANEIESSAESNRQYYMKESVDEFFEFRQKLTDRAFDTQGKFATLRSKLMSDLSRDLFRTFAFIIAIAATAIFRLSNVLPPVPTYLGVSAILVLYSVVTLRRIRGIRSQFLDLIKTQKNHVDFYGNFFNEDELEKRGVSTGKTYPWWGKPLRAWWSFWEKEVDYPKLRCDLALDLIIYYCLILIILLIAVFLTSEALRFTNFISEIPA